MMPPVMMQPPLQAPQQIAAPSAPAEEKVEQEEPDNQDTLDNLRPTTKDKEQIEKILADPDPRWQSSQFVNFLKDLKERPAVDGGTDQMSQLVSSQWAEEFLKNGETGPQMNDP